MTGGTQHAYAAMYLVCARALLRPSSLGSQLPCRPTLKTPRSQLRRYSKCDTPYETPVIKFGTENASSPSLSCFTLETSLHLRAPLHRVWEAFHVPCTLNAITPPHLNFTVTTPQPVGMQEGTIIDYRCSPRCIAASQPLAPRSLPLTPTLRPQPVPPRRALQMAHTARLHCANLHPSPPHLRPRISRWDPPHGFQDEQVCARACEGPPGQSPLRLQNCRFSLRLSAVQELGPYSLWQHHHAYTATCDERGDGTLCSDIVRRERCLRRLLRARAPGHVCAGTGFRCRHWAIWRISGCALAWQRLRS